MLSSLDAGRYTSRSSARLSVEVAIFMYAPLVISENITRCSPNQDSPEAFGSMRQGIPPGTGTTQVSQTPRSTVVYAMRAPSGEKTGLIFLRLSLVTWNGSPSGKNFTYTCPGP